MEIDIIKAFIHIAEGNTFQDTAEEFNMSQPSLSKAIARMEDGIGLNLLSREKRVVSLTPAGRRFYDEMKRIMGDYDRSVRQLQSWAKEDYIAMCAFPSIDMFGIRESLIQYSTEYPEELLDIIVATDYESAESQLLDGKITFLVTHTGRNGRRHMDITYMCDDPVCVLLPLNHPLTEKKELLFQDLEGESLAVGRFSKEMIRKLSTSLEVYPKLQSFNPPFESRIGVISNVANGHGCAIFFLSELEKFNLSQVAVRYLADAPKTPLSLLNKQGITLSGCQQKFKKYMVEEARLYQKKNRCGTVFV
ncbi:LysR family transcriptional regulator [Hungatella hathewayi]